MGFAYILDNLRRNLENTFSQMGFITDVEGDNYNCGGQRSVEITCLDPKEQIYKWMVKNRPGDIYYFPYLNGGNGIGYVIVPKCVPDGTIVVTGGMNGCALQVNMLDDRNLIFMHDQDAKAIAAPEGREQFISRLNHDNGFDFKEADLTNSWRILCRVEPDHYMGVKSIYYNYQAERVHELHPEKGSYMAYYPFFVKGEGMWRLYMSLVGTVGDKKSGPLFFYN